MIFAAVSSRSRSLSFLKGLGISWYPKSHNKNHIMKTKEMSRGRRKRPSIVLGHMERTPSRAWNEELALQNFHPATSSDQAFERCANKSSMTWYLK
jgi:hypothetical protein